MDDDLGRYRPMACPDCGSVGTIVEYGLCCRVQHWIRLGGIWEVYVAARDEWRDRG